MSDYLPTLPSLLTSDFGYELILFTGPEVAAACPLLAQEWWAQLWNRIRFSYPNHYWQYFECIIAEQTTIDWKYIVVAAYRLNIHLTGHLYTDVHRYRQCLEHFKCAIPMPFVAYTLSLLMDTHHPKDIITCFFAGQFRFHNNVIFRQSLCFIQDIIIDSCHNDCQSYLHWIQHSLFRLEHNILCHWVLHWIVYAVRKTLVSPEIRVIVQHSSDVRMP